MRKQWRILLLAASGLLMALPAHSTGTIHVDTCVKLTDSGHENLARCPVAHVSDNPYTKLELSPHKYILLTKDKPIVLEVEGPGEGLRELYLWKYKDGKVFTGGDYTITIIRDDKEFVEKTFAIKPYPKHKIYGSAERTQVDMPKGKHKLEIRLSSEAEGEVVFYWKVAPLEATHLVSDWKPWPKS